MRVLKGNTSNYVPFYQAVRDIAVGKQASSPGYEQAGDIENVQEELGFKLFEKHSYYLKVILAFEKEVSSISATNNDPLKLLQTLKNAVKKIVTAKDVFLYLLDEGGGELEPFDPDTSEQTSKALNTYYKEGVLNLLFENRNPIFLPHFESYSQLGSKLNYLLFPIVEDAKKRGLFAALIAGGEPEMDDLGRQILDMLFRNTMASLDRLLFRGKINKLYEELQTYQAKLSNDFRLAAVGELTEGIVEEIVSPLQVIMSYVDLLEKEGEDSQEIKKIKGQINKINAVISRLVKFASLNQKNVTIAPCNLNDIISEYHRLVKSSLDSLKLECVLDFEQNLPPILTHPNYANQLLANVFGLIKTRSKGEIGILLQTRFKIDTVFVKFICTIDVVRQSASAQDLKTTSNMTMKIIENLMKKHEGYIKIESFQGNGSQIMLGFPLKRKIRL